MTRELEDAMRLAREEAEQYRARTAREKAAKEFAQAVREFDGVQGVWARETRPELEVVVVMRDLDLNRELELRGIFIEMMCATLGAGEGELRVYAESEGIPDWLRDDDLIQRPGR